MDIVYYVMVKRNKQISCHGGFSLEFAAYAKRKRLKKKDPYIEVEIKKKQTNFFKRTKVQNEMLAL